MNRVSKHRWRPCTLILVLCLSVLILSTESQAKAFAYGKRILNRYAGLTIGLDIYESYASIFCNIKREPPREVEPGNGMRFYRTLFLHSFKPYYFLIQASDYSLAHAVVLFKRNNPQLYHDLDWDLSVTEINVLEMFAFGYEEPYAFSFFLGHLTPFWQITESNEKRQIGSAISGFVVTIGNRHIKELELVKDNWYEIKWSLKGEKGPREHHIQWNIQFGGKVHDHPEIFDVFFFRLYRDHLNRAYYGGAFSQNSSFEYRVEMPVQKSSSIFQISDLFCLHYLGIGKKFPSRRWKRVVYKVDTGIYWKKYKDCHNLNESSGTLTWSLRPNIVF